MRTSSNAVNLRLKSAMVGAIALTVMAACSTTDPDLGDAGPAQSSAQVAAAQGKNKEDDPRVCKLITQVGTKVARRVCVRQSDWDAMQGTGNKVTTEMQNRSVQAGNPTGGN